MRADRPLPLVRIFLGAGLLTVLVIVVEFAILVAYLCGGSPCWG